MEQDRPALNQIGPHCTQFNQNGPTWINLAQIGPLSAKWPSLDKIGPQLIIFNKKKLWTLTELANLNQFCTTRGQFEPIWTDDAIVTYYAHSIFCCSSDFIQLMSESQTAKMCLSKRTRLTNQIGPNWTKLDQVGPHWTILDKIVPIWPKMDHCQPIGLHWKKLDLNESYWRRQNYL